MAVTKITAATLHFNHLYILHAAEKILPYF